MAAHRWDTAPAEGFPSRLAARRLERLGGPGGSREGGRQEEFAYADGGEPLGRQPPTDVPAEAAAAGYPRRWRFPLRAGVLAACLLLAAAAAIPLLRERPAHETVSVEVEATQGPASASDGEAAVEPHAGALPDLTGTGTQQPAPAPGIGTAAGGELVVHVAGAVATPGIVRIQSGGRVADAVEAAGGATAEADLTQVNLAALMEDGSMVVVPAAGDQGAPGDHGAPANGRAGLPGAAAGASGQGPGAGGVSGGLINLNTASEVELQDLPRVGPVLAERIVAWRADHGAFSRPEDLDAVPGIGEVMLAALLPLVTV